MLKEMFKKKEVVETKPQVATINPNDVQETKTEIERIEIPESSIIVGSEIIGQGTFRYIVESTKILSIGFCDIKNQE